MSSTGRGKPREPVLFAEARSVEGRDVLDRDYTQPALAEAIVRALPDSTPLDFGVGWTLEPHVGSGAFARAIKKRWPHPLLCGLDIDPAATGARDCDRFEAVDFLAPPVPIDPFHGPSLIIGNPPYGAAEAHVRQALDVVSRQDGSVVFLLLLGFLESDDRGFQRGPERPNRPRFPGPPLWQAYPPTAVDVLSKRPSFRGGKTDMRAYAVFRWTFRDGAPVARLPVGWLDWSE